MAALVRGQGDEGGAGARDERHEQAPCGRQRHADHAADSEDCASDTLGREPQGDNRQPTPTLIAPPNAV